MRPNASEVSGSSESVKSCQNVVMQNSVLDLQPEFDRHYMNENEWITLIYFVVGI